MADFKKPIKTTDSDDEDEYGYQRGYSGAGSSRQLNPIATYFAQLLILLKKNWKLAYRGWKSTAAMLLAPIAFLLILLIIQYVPSAQSEDNDPKIEPIPLLSKCHGRNEKSTDCYSLFYSPNTDPQINDLMTIFATRNHLNLSISTDLDIKQGIVGWGANSSVVRDWVRKHQNKTQGYIEFSAPYKSQNKTIFPYVLQYNGTCRSIVERCKDYRPEILRALGDALTVYYTNNSDVEFKMSTSKYPILSPPSDAVKTYGSLFFYCGSMFFFIILLYQIVYEKEYKLRQGMKMMGLQDAAYWTALFIESQIINILSVLLLICTGLACDFAFFRMTNFGVLLLVFYVFVFAMTQLAFLISTLINSTKIAIYMSMMIFILGVLLTLIFSLFGASVFPLLYKGGSIATPFRYILDWVPMYNFAKAVFDINNLSYTLGEIEGSGYKWGDLYKKFSLGNSGGDALPATIDSIYYQLWLIIVFSVLTFYFDNALPGANGGTNYGFFFFFRPSWWGCVKRRAKGTFQKVHPLHDGEQLPSDLQEISGDSVVQALRLVKVYQGMPLLKRKSDVLALRGFSASLDEGQIFCMLGHNGAGKTTTVSIMTGLFEPTYGDAFIYGHSVVSDMPSIRRIMGVCPQHDILWNELTAREHLEIFADLKNVPGSERKMVVDDKLQSVNLLDVGDKLAGGFSGGMKRRLSVAISCIGEPKIIFMDEPTTGMDPMSRRHVWNLIQQLKKGRVIVLTTHSMEEADVLGDRIAIMSHGTIRCLGTPLHLKNEFGEGYRINVTARPDAIDEAKGFINKHLPGSVLIAETSEYLVYGLPHTSIQHVVPFFKLIERMGTGTATQKSSKKSQRESTDGEEIPIITDCSISHTTLEEVFLKVTRRAAEEEKGKKVDAWDHLTKITAPLPYSTNESA